MADDFAALHYVGGELHDCVASRRGARCYSVQAVDGEVREQELPTRLLG